MPTCVWCLLCQKALSYPVQTTWFKSVGGHERWRSEERFCEEVRHTEAMLSQIWVVWEEKRAFQIRRAVYERAGLESCLTTPEALQNFNPGAWCLGSSAAPAT